MRKDVWQNFPVCLVQLGKDTNGAERHAVVWNRKKLVEWRKNCPDPNSWYSYEQSVILQLMAELRRSNKWIVEPQEKSDQICVIRMRFKSGSQDNAKNQPSLPCNPLLTRLTDIKMFFPMAIWHEQSQTQANTKVYTIEISNKKLKAYSNPVNEVTNLLAALKASTAWKVEPGQAYNELCRIVMA